MKRFFRPRHLVLLVGNLLAASSFSVDVASPQASSQADSRSPFETLSQIERADSIRIKDEWEGYGPFSPISAFWDLHRTQDGFAGTAIFRAHPHFSPLSVASGSSRKGFHGHGRYCCSFGECEKLPEQTFPAHLSTRAYVPSIPRTASYPSISIEIEVDHETITFFTRSQGKDHIPWGVTIQGETYVVVSSDVPARALEEDLDPHLKREMLEELLNTVK